MSAEKVVSVCSKISGLLPAIVSAIPQYTVVDCGPSLPRDVVHNSDYLIADNDTLLDGEFLTMTSSRLKFVQVTWAGVEGLASAVKTSGITPSIPLARFCNPAFSNLMAEYCVASVINMERRFSRAWRAQRNKVWDTSVELLRYRSVSELRVGILGVGNMGLATAKMFHGLGSTVVGLVNSPRQPDHAVTRFYIREELKEMLSEVDYILAMLPSTPQTDDILGQDILSCCANRGVGLVNIGRGNIISEDHLIEALHKNWIRAAVLDVFREEPLPVSSRLWEHPDVMVTPHVAGETRPGDIAMCFKKNLERQMEGLQPESLMSWQKLY